MKANKGFFTTLLPNVDKKQSIRLRRLLYAFYGGLIHTIVCLLLWVDNVFRVSGQELALLFSTVWLVNICFYFFIRIGWNLRFSDPSLTVPLMIWGISCLMYTVFLTTELRAMLLMFQFFVLFFGTFHLSMKAFLMVILYGIFSYLVVIYALHEYYPMYIDMREEWISFSSFSLVSFAYAIIGYEMLSIREYLQSKNEKLSSALQYIESISITDELTGIKNRRYIMGVLEEQTRLGERRDYMFSVILLDIDFFKNINDSYGHKIGDKVLIELCNKVTETMRKIDYFARYGGEEFLFVLPFSNEEQALQGAERVRSLIEGANFDSILPGLKVTVSLGVTQYHRHEEIQSLLERVDKALYRAKEQGRNQVVVG